MSKRAAAILFATLTVAACNNGSPTTTSQPTSAATSVPAGTTAPASQGAGEVDPNTVAGFCQLMTDTITANWPPKDSQAATVISPFLRNWAQIAAFAAVSADLLAVADWTASMSIMNPVPAPPSDVAAAWDKILAFQTSSC
jgi:hypothetical protein